MADRPSFEGKPLAWWQRDEPVRILTWSIAIAASIAAIVWLAHAAWDDAKPKPAPPAAAHPGAGAGPSEAAFQRAVSLMRRIKASANDPDSIEVAEAFYTADGTVVVKFRGRNAFNAKVLNVAIWTGDGKHSVSGSMHDVATVWNRYVARKPTMDLTGALHGAASLYAY